MLLIPAIDLKDGRCVRLRQGDLDDATVFSEDPAAMASHWLDLGARRLHLVDLNGAVAGKPKNEAPIKAILQAVGDDIPVQIGGGIRDLDTIERYLDAGISYVIIGTAAVKNPGFLQDACGAFPGQIIVGLDARDGKVATDGWSKLTRHDVLDLAKKFEDYGCEAIIYTDIGRDGMLGRERRRHGAAGAARAHPGVRLRRHCRPVRYRSPVRGRGRRRGRRHPGPQHLRRRARLPGCPGPRRRTRQMNASRIAAAGASTLTRRIIPCLDVTAGRVVKGVNFVNLTDAGDPVEIARRYNEQGADELTFLDITATSDGRDLILPIIEQVASQVFIPLTVGGGVRQVSDVQRLLNAGADKISINSAAVANPELVRAAADYHGSQCIVVAIDARRSSAEGEPARWEVFTHGGRKATGLDAVAWARRMAAYGAGEILLTSMDRDGTKSGFDLELTRAVSDAVPVPVIASGGVGNLQHLADGVTTGRASAVLAASIFHFGQHTVRECKQYMAERGIAVRLT